MTRPRAYPPPFDTDPDTTVPVSTRHVDASATRSHTEAWVDYHAATVAAARAPDIRVVLTRR